jgi:hypothetical protein
MSLIRWNTLAWPWKFLEDTPSLARLAIEPGSATPLDTTPDLPQVFGTDAIWLAIRSPSTQAVAQALQLDYASPANWCSGLQAVHQPLPCTPGLVFVTPPIHGWVLVTGALPYPGGTSDSDLASSLLQLLSEQFAQVQYFGAHSGIGWHGYARYEKGSLARAFACVDNVDHTIWDFGSKHDVPTLTDQGHNGAVNDPESGDAVWHQSRVFQLAERWSVNPQRFNHRDLPPSLGLVGLLDVRRLGSDTPRCDSPLDAWMVTPSR